VLLLLLGVVHLVATPHIASLIQHLTSAGVAKQLTPPMLLNHVLVGVLLLPLGYLALYAAPHAAVHARWAQIIVRTIAIAVAAMPVALLALMGKREYFDAPMFDLGVALVVAAAGTLLVAAFITPRDLS
jgi:hypothetical protein